MHSRGLNVCRCLHQTRKEHHDAESTHILVPAQ